MRRSRTRRRATALVITVALLAVLAVVGFGFAVLSRLQHDAARHYRAAADVDLLSHAAVMYAVRDIRYGYAAAKPAMAEATHSVTLEALHSLASGTASQPIEWPGCPWYVDPGFASGLFRHDNGTPGDFTDDEPTNVYRYCNLKNSSYALVHDVLGTEVAVSLVTVLDAAGKLNLNDDNDRLDNMLDTLITELDINGTSVDYLGPDEEDKVHGNDIVLYRNSLTGQRFTSLEQLLNVRYNNSPANPLNITRRRLDVLRHYVTLYSWPQEPTSQVDSAATQNPVTRYITLPERSLASYPSLDYDTDKIRCPVNLNTAPYEVLVAVLTNIKSRVGATTKTITETTAKEVAKWIVRKRDPENPYHWRTDGGFSAAWKAWLTDAGYKDKARKRDAHSWRHYALGPFDSWNEFIAFMYDLTDTGVGDDDPFRPAIALDEEEAEAIIAAVCPNSFATIAPWNAWHQGFARLKQDALGTVQEIRAPKETAAPNDRLYAEVTGKNDLTDASVHGADGYNTEFCFSSRGRFEVTSRTFAFVKADFGEAYGSEAGSEWYRLTDETKTWGLNPPQWRGYSVLIYDGDGKGQLRGIVANLKDTDGHHYLAVAKWSTQPSDTDATPYHQSRYYILGPGPLLDRVAAQQADIEVDGQWPHLLKDTTAPWEDNEFDGHRIVVYKSQVVDNEETIIEGSIQERIILATDKAAKVLVLSPELDAGLLDCTDVSDRLGYIVLGTNGKVAHEAALKAYEAIQHTTQKDFAPNNAAPASVEIAIGPNPLANNVDQEDPAITSSPVDGWITMDKEPVDSNKFKKDATNLVGDLVFRQNFERADLGSDFPATNPPVVGTNPADLVGDVFEIKTGPLPGGRLFTDGLYLRGGSGHWLGYKAVGSPAAYIVKENSFDPAGDEIDGGFVFLWFRPDRYCLDTSASPTARTILCIRGKDSATGDNDLRLIMDGTTLKLVVRGDGAQPYNAAQLTDADGNDKTANCRAGTFTGPQVDVHNTTESAIASKWKPGEWHQIAFAWYEAVNSASLANSDDDPDSTEQNDGPTDAPKYDEIDENEVIGLLRLWVDGVAVTNQGTVQAFNLRPNASTSPQTHPTIQIGEDDSAPAGTVDGIVAFAIPFDDTAAPTNKLDWLDTPVTNARNDTPRYQDEVVTYTSEDFHLPSVLTNRGDVCLGTVSWTGLYPWCAKPGQDWNATTPFSAHYPITVRVKLGTTSESDDMPDATSTDKQPVLGGGGPILSSGDRMHSGSATTISYEVDLDPYAYEDDEGVRLYWQTPLLDDITITYFGPVVFMNWR